MKPYQKVGFVFVMLALCLTLTLTEKTTATVPAEPLDSEEVEKNLELPDIHENTIIYNGTINPDLILGIRFPGEDILESPYVNEAGQFSVNLTQGDLEAGDEIVFVLGQDGKISEERMIQVQPEEEGKEVIQSSADTSAVEEVIVEGTTITWPEDIGYIRMDVETIGDELEGPMYYALEGVNIHEDKQLEYLGETNHSVLIAMADEEEEVNAPDFPKPGDTVTLYIAALGVTAEIESDIPEHLDAWHGTEASGQENDKESESEELSTENNQSDSNVNDNGTTDDERNVEETASSVSDSNTNGGAMSPIIWTMIGSVVIAILISLIVWNKRRNRAGS